MSEKRDKQRSPIELAASFGIPHDSPAIQTALVINMSSGGFCFYSKEKIKIGSIIKLVVDLSPSEKVQVNVKTIWINELQGLEKYMVGVQIIDTAGSDLEKFLQFYSDQEKSN